MVKNDFDFLVDETMDLVSVYQGQDPFQFSWHFNDDYFDQIPESCGILFRLNKNSHSFSLRCIPSENLKEDVKILFKDLEQRGENHKTQELKQSLHWFSLEDFELSEILADKFNGKKFSHFDQDPFYGSSDEQKGHWWMHKDDHSFNLYFGTCKKGEYLGRPFLKLGPLSDCDKASARFKESFAVLKDIFPISEFICYDDHVLINSLSESHQSHENYELFKNMFLTGIENQKIFSVYFKEFSPQLYQFYKEIFATRRFWINLESHLI